MRRMAAFSTSESGKVSVGRITISRILFLPVGAVDLIMVLFLDDFSIRSRGQVGGV